MQLTLVAFRYDSEQQNGFYKCFTNSNEEKRVFVIWENQLT